jgi:hypothetical protein
MFLEDRALQEHSKTGLIAVNGWFPGRLASLLRDTPAHVRRACARSCSAALFPRSREKNARGLPPVIGRIVVIAGVILMLAGQTDTREVGLPD